MSAVKWSQSGLRVMARSDTLRGDRILLSQSILEDLLKAASGSFDADSAAALPSPLVFSIVNMTNRSKTFATVKEFTAQADDCVEMSREVFDSLNIAMDQAELTKVRLTLETDLQKCEYLKVAPMEPEYLELPDIRALLESHLRRNRATISMGDIILVSHLDKSNTTTDFHFLVTEIQPENTCICIDVDISLDIVPDQKIAEEAVRRKFLQPKPANISGPSKLQLTEMPSSKGEFRAQVSGSITSDTFQYYKFKYSCASHFRIELEPTSGDCDLFASVKKEEPSFQDHDVYNVDVGLSVVHISSPPSSLSPFIYIAVKGHASKSTYTLTVTSQSSPPLPAQPKEAAAMMVEETPCPPNYFSCTNCLTHIPLRTRPMHEAFCFRNNAICMRCKGVGLPAVMKKQDLEQHWHCDECDKVGTKNKSEKHLKLVHAPIPCDCGLYFTLNDISRHRSQECPERLIECRFCHLLVRAGPKSRTVKDILLGESYSEHESECGSRTFKCIKCGQSVQLKDMKIHTQMHDIAKQNQPTPLLCANAECSNFINEQFKNPMKLCQACYNPFWSPRHDPGNQKLAAKLASTYNTQLTAGCGKPYCSNKYCVTSTNNELLSEPMSPTDAAIHVVTLIKQSFLFNSASPSYSICVANETTARRRQAAQALVGIGFRLEWCIKALASCFDDSSAATNWLLANAPKY